MNNNVVRAFANGTAFMPFIMGGDPDLPTTEKLLRTLYENGADLIEIGIPFSDPVAEGPVIEAAAERALAAGCTVDKLFEMVTRVKKDIPIPLLFMTYYNPIFVYGADKFSQRCVECGIEGLIVPDLPLEEMAELRVITDAHDLALISLISPTSQGRIKQIVDTAEGFLYCVSNLGVTGERDKLGQSAAQMVAEVKKIRDIPCAVGFGISTAEQASEVAKFADGVIVGSAIVRIIAEHGRESVEPVAAFAKGIKAATE